MTRRRSERELERDGKDLEAPGGEATLDEWWFANLKAGAGTELGPREQRIIEDPERYLPDEVWRDLQEWWAEGVADETKRAIRERRR